MKIDVFVSFNLVISGRMDRASTTVRVDSGLTLGRIKSKTTAIGIYCFPA